MSRPVLFHLTDGTVHKFANELDVFGPNQARAIFHPGGSWHDWDSSRRVQTIIPAHAIVRIEILEEISWQE